MVSNSKDVMDLTKVSFSFIPSLKCNNRCSFCMYNASPENNTALDYDKTVSFMKTVDWGKVVGWGLYGGEPSIDIPLYQRFYKLLPPNLPKFIITNGAWSTSEQLTSEFLDWCTRKFYIIISGTKEHRAHQSVTFLNALACANKGMILYKEEDEEMHPMGGLTISGWMCSQKCTWHKQVLRLGIFPTGHIIMQNCDGVYPVVGHIDKTDFNKAFSEGVRVRTHGCNAGKVLNVNDLTQNKWGLR